MSILGVLGSLAASLRPHDEPDSSRIGLRARGGATARRLWRQAVGRPKGWRPAPFFGAIETRQQKRAAARQLAFLEISEQYPGELRSARRRMALAIARRTWKQVEGAAA